MKTFFLIFVLFFSFSCRYTLFANNTRQSPEDDKVYNALRLSGQKLELNGLPSEGEWAESGWKSRFTARSPVDGAKPTQKTEFSILYDDTYIYVAFKLYDDEPEKIDARISRKDTWGGDAAVVYIDSYYDKQTAFMFGVTAGGVKNDGVASQNSEHADMNPDPIWDAKTAMTDYGWAVEMRIPLSELRFPDTENPVWGLQVARYIYRNEEYVLWRHISQKEAGWAANFGELHGLKNLNKNRQLQITPYVLGKYSHYPAEKGNPYADGNDFSANIGLNAKIGISNNMTLNVALNPDFGQVEADPSEVNLSAYESYFSEKRPFFVEGSNLIDYRISKSGQSWTRDNLFYSRRIGRKVRYSPELTDGEYAQIPDFVKIPLAVKLTGKTENGWSVGISNAMTSRTLADIQSEDRTRKEGVEPFTNYFAARVSKDINKGQTQIGGMLTSVNRNIKDEQLKFLPDNAYTGGIDAVRYFNDFKYFVSGTLVGSYISGDTTAISDLQLASTRYFQRPDAEHLDYDPARTHLSGYGAALAAGKDASEGWRFRFNVSLRSPGLELNDLGYLRSADAVYQYFWTGYKIAEPFSVFQLTDFRFKQWYATDFGGQTLESGMTFVFSSQFTNRWNLFMNYNRNGRSLSNRMLRGGPGIVLPPSQSGFLWMRSDQTRPVYAAVSAFHRQGEYDYFDYTQFGAEIGLHPGPRTDIKINARYSASGNELQYITELESGEQPIYLTGNISQKTFSLSINAAFSINPNLSIQYYGSPFVSNALYSDFKKITQGDADDYYERYSAYSENRMLYDAVNNVYEFSEEGENLRFDNPDFNFRQFRSNLVLRWEYRPGSQLFLVWSQDRTESLSDGQIGIAESLADMFKTGSNDVFLVKFSYLINV